jgi:predicted GH43/DUF377 family glycosyl hydrolase
MRNGVGLLLAVGLGCSAALHAQSIDKWEIGPFTRPLEGNPIITARAESTFQDPIKQAPVYWEKLQTFNPAAVVRNGKVYVLYRAEDDSGEMKIGGHCSRIGLAESDDGVHFTRRAEPVFFAAKDSQEAREWPGGTEDPRVVESEDGTYVMTYTQVTFSPTHEPHWATGLATSRDLLHWTKYGPVFQDASDGKYTRMNYKSCGIVTRLDEKKGRLIAARIDGRYWMYWGENAIRLATSTDLVHWSPVEDASGNALELLHARPHRFDSGYPEVGPPPVLTGDGIILMYNGINAASGGDADLGPGAAGAGEALFDAKEPSRLIARTESPVLKPETPYEKTGQYVPGDTFTEGLVYFHKQWFLYYGCADKMVAVAIAPQK